MSDERRDDEILGRALSRAIETIDVNQTPYERSRIATTPARRSTFGFWQIATAAAAIVLAIAIGSWLTRPTESQPGVAASPSAPGATSSGATPTPAPSATPRATTAPTAVDHAKIYLARPSVPPVAVALRGFPDTVTTPRQRIASRVTALRAYRQSGAPANLTNYLWNNSFQGGVQVAIAGDLATVDLLLEQPLVAKDHPDAFAILQQLVYTATEEPGVRRVLFTQNGGLRMSIGDILIDRPLAREDVLGYSVRGPTGRDQGIKGGGDTSPIILGSRVVTSNDGTLVSFTVEPRDASGNAAKLPPFEVWMDQGDDRSPTGGKYKLIVSLLWNITGSTGGAAHVSISDETPLRATVDATAFWELQLDDARPWRAYVSPTGTKLTVDLGGDPRTISDRIAVYRPTPSTTIDSRISRTFTVSGAARVFEANVSWRLKDASGKTAASGHFLASLGSSALWGTFDAPITIPTALQGTGPVTLELYEASPKDGSEQGLVAIPLMIR